MDQFERARALLPGVQEFARWTISALMCTAAAGLFALANTVRLSSELDQARSARHPTGVEDRGFFELCRLTTRADGILLVAAVVTGALFLTWLWKARDMAADLRNRVPEGDAWVLLGWFPFVNLVVPYSLVTGLYGDADPYVPPGDEVEHRHGRAWWLLALWWAPALVVLMTFNLRLFDVLGRPVRLVAPQLAGADVVTLSSTLFVDVIVLGCMTVALLGAVLVVSRVTSRLEACAERFGTPAIEPVGDQSLVTAAASHRPD